MTDATASPSRTRRAVAGALALLVVGAALGYGLGSWRGGVSEHVGDAVSTETQISIQTDDWTYAVPLDVQWTDAEGGWHSGSRPECLPPGGEVRDIRFAAVPVETRGTGFRQVVAVFCD